MIQAHILLTASLLALSRPKLYQTHSNPIQQTIRPLLNVIWGCEDLSLMFPCNPYTNQLSYPTCYRPYVTLGGAGSPPAQKEQHLTSGFGVPLAH